MRARFAAAAVLAPLLQVAMLERLPAGPDLVMLVAVTAGPAMGPVAGAVTGFATGLVADLVPPALPPAGRTALLLCVLGYACGLLPRKIPVAAGILAGGAAGTLAATGAGLLIDGWPDSPALAALLIDGWPDRPALAALPLNLIAVPLVWLLLAGRGRSLFRRHSDATLPPGPVAGVRAVRRPARPTVAGADPGRRALHGSRRRRPRTPHRHPGRARAHPR
ncbi:hypothetical protein [Nonomuraea sp. NPDC050786]|uniref:hypothetical protein n=1 Tax=Nonomuraea sp. NPDC050786 TaxID=3154840 RepID=UPI0033F4EDE1